ncbi:hypothetical protein [Rhizobacter fulvus]
MTAPLTSWRETEAWLRARLADGELHDMHETKRAARTARVSVGRLAALAARLCERVPGPGGGGWWRLLPPQQVAPFEPPASRTPWRAYESRPFASIKTKKGA